MEFTGTTAFAPPSTVSGSGTWEFDGGTGRFSTATGTGTYEFTYDLVANVGNLTQVGTISR